MVAAPTTSSASVAVHPLIPTMLSELAFDREVGPPPPQQPHSSLTKNKPPASSTKSFLSSWSGLFCLSFEDPDMFYDAQESHYDHDVHDARAFQTGRSRAGAGTARTTTAAPSSTTVAKLRGGGAGHKSFLCCNSPRHEIVSGLHYSSDIRSDGGKGGEHHQRAPHNRASATVAALPPHLAAQRNNHNHNQFHDTFHTADDSLDRSLQSQSEYRPNHHSGRTNGRTNAIYAEEIHSPPVEVGPDGVVCHHHPHHSPTPPSVPTRRQAAAGRKASRVAPATSSPSLPSHNPFTRRQAPTAPPELPIRFLRAGKGDPVEGRRRYEATLAWRKEHGIDGILLEAHPDFELIKEHYPHYYHLRGRNGEPVFFEQPPKTNLQALKAGGIDLSRLVRHYTMVTEFQWQYIERNDLARSITVLDLEGIRMMDFVGDCVDYVKKCSHFTGQHYPERAGHVIVVNVPKWFSMIWSVVKPMVDEVTLKKISIVRGKQQVYDALLEKIPEENIPPEYGGKSPTKLGDSPQEGALRDLVAHNNALARGDYSCGGRAANPPCPFCSWVPVRSY